MASQTEQLVGAIEAWREDCALSEIGLWRGDPDALTPAQIAERHAALRGPRVRDAFLEQAERGSIIDEERAAIAAWLRDAHTELGRDAAATAMRAALQGPVPYDSDHHRGVDLIGRLAATPTAARRRAMASALEATWDAALRARRSGRARIEDMREEASWLVREAPHPDERATGDDHAEAILESTGDAWSELKERLTHAASTRPEHYADLLHALRAPRWDDLVPPASRWRRLADRLVPLGLAEPLSTQARIEPPARGLRTEVVVLVPRKDVRIGPGPEIGLATERDATIALGYAAATLLAHPGLPILLARPRGGSVARALGYLIAHLWVDPGFGATARAVLTATQRREVAELALGLELFELRTLAAAVLSTPHHDATDLSDVAHAHVRRAWGVDVSPSLAATIALEPSAHSRLRAARWAAPVYVALREQFDEDFWRNPRVSEPIRYACGRGGTLSVEAWMEELGIDGGTLGVRMTELLS